MSRYKLINRQVVDVMVDIKGNNKPEDKVIIHPKTSIEVSLTDELVEELKKANSVVIVKL